MENGDWTRNCTEAIDLAFLDRADIKQLVGLPGPTCVAPWL